MDDGRLTRDKAHEIAVRMLHREHDRWNQNSLFFFGSLVSIFVIQKSVDDLTGSLIAPWMVYLLAAAVSLMTLSMTIAVRMSTDAWRDSVSEIESRCCATDLRPFEIYQKYYDTRPYWKPCRDFLVTLGFLLVLLLRPLLRHSNRCKYLKDTHLLSVTRMITLLAFIAFAIFAYFSYSTYRWTPLIPQSHVVTPVFIQALRPAQISPVSVNAGCIPIFRFPHSSYNRPPAR